jgi:hypothetical protein
MPGGLKKEWLYLQNVTINMPEHPLLNIPFLVEDDELDNWLYSAHGYFTEYPGLAKEILMYPVNASPVLIEFPFGDGFVVATMQTLEWNENLDYTRLLENLILYDPVEVSFVINVTSPVSGDSWEVRTTQTITWDATPNIDNVKIELYENGVFVQEIVASTLNDGSFTWTVPIGLSDSTLYQIKISDASFSDTNDMSENFEIFDQRSITVDTPDSTSSWVTGDTEQILWNSTGIIPTVKIDLYASGYFIIEIAASTPNDGSFDWLIPDTLVNYTEYVIRVSDAGDLALYDESPQFEITSPEDGVIAGYEVFIMFSVLIGVSVILIRRKRKNSIIS